MLVLLILFLIGFFLSYYKINLWFGISNIFILLIFFFSGKLYRYFFTQLNAKSKFVTVIVCLFLFVYLMMFHVSVIDLRLNSLESGNYLICVLSVILGLISLTGSGQMILNKINISCISGINYIGKNSMIFFVTHWIVINLYLHILTIMQISTNGKWNLPILLILTIMTGVFLTKPINQNKLLIGK